MQRAREEAPVRAGDGECGRRRAEWVGKRMRTLQTVAGFDSSRTQSARGALSLARNSRPQHGHGQLVFRSRRPEASRPLGIGARRVEIVKSQAAAYRMAEPSSDDRQDGGGRHAPGRRRTTSTGAIRVQQRRLIRDGPRILCEPGLGDRNTANAARSPWAALDLTEARIRAPRLFVCSGYPDCKHKDRLRRGKVVHLKAFLPGAAPRATAQRMPARLNSHQAKAIESPQRPRASQVPSGVS